MSRHFGIQSGRLIPWGHSGNQPSAYGATKYERADPYPLPPLPAQSIRPDPMTDADRSRIAGRFATVFLSLVFLVPLFCIGVMFKFR